MLSHPNIISYYDSFDEDGTLWIEMEYADGGFVFNFSSRHKTFRPIRSYIFKIFCGKKALNLP